MMRLKHRWSFKLNYLLGITLDKWLKLLRTNRVDAVYWHRATLISCLSLMNSLYQRREQRLFAQAVGATPITRPPIFIIGHWRSGTTHLANLLGLDDDLVFPNSYQVANPYTFLCTEQTNTRRFAALMPSRRPMDNMPLGFDTPQEDEFALCLMTLHSPYLGMSFPKRQYDYLQYMTFDNAPDEVITGWKEAFILFLRKLTFKYQGRTVVFKSPCQTARLKLILEIFPSARFIHLVRHPHDVFKSTCHLYDTIAWYLYLQQPGDATDDFIIKQYNTMYDAYFAQRSLISDEQFYEVRYEELVGDPYRILEAIWRKFDLGDFTRFTSKLAPYLERIKGYQKNTYEPLSPALRDKISEVWRPNFLAWGY
jgi:hypothetical protein